MKSFTFVLALVLGMGSSSVVYAQDPFANAVVEENPSVKQDSLPNGEVSVKDKDFDQYLQSQIKFSVPVMSIEQLKQIKDSRQKIYILDARSREEYEISHIEGARRVGFDDFSVEKVWNLDRNTKVVVYCGIGERSEKIAERLKQMGF
jgi:rhodanese-related sulfurtransferase